MVRDFVVIYQGECPPGDQGVGSEHGIHIFLYWIYAIARQMKASLCQWWMRWWWAVIK